MKAIGQDTLKTRRTLTVQGKSYDYFSLAEAAKSLGDISRLPVSLKVLLENVLRFEDGTQLHGRRRQGDRRLAAAAHSDKEVPFKPARILLQDFTGVPAVVDLAAMRDGITRLGGDPQKVNPLVPVDLVIDHSVHGRRLRPPRRAGRRTSTSSSSATASATGSCAGARTRSTTSASCRRAPASATR